MRNIEKEIEKICKDNICIEWVALSMLSESSEEDKNFLDNKIRFWEKNKEHLSGFGFSFEDGSDKALSDCIVNKIDSVSNCLLVVRVGNEKNKPTESEIESVEQLMSAAFDGCDNVKILIVPYSVDIQKLSLPKLAKIYNEVSREDANNNPIINGIEF